MRKLILVCSGICLTISMALGQKPVAQKALTLHEGRQAESYTLFSTPRQTGEALEVYVDNALSLTLQEDMLSAIQNAREGVLKLQLPAPINRQLDLYEAEVFSADATISTSDGRSFTPNPNNRYYRGMVHGKQNSLAVVSVFEDKVHILFADDEGNKRIQQSEGYQYIYFADKDIRIPKDLECYTDQIDQPYFSDSEKGIGSRMTGNCVEVYAEADHECYIDNNESLPETEEWLGLLWNEVITLYENEEIPVALSSALIYTEPDPFVNLNSTSAVLTAFRQHIDTLDYDGRLAHFLSTRSLGGGIAYVNVLCSNTHQVAVSASLSTNIVPFPTYSWTVEVVTHEMGHNMGSRHTHGCYWNGNSTQIDDCGNVWAANNNNTPEGNACFDENNPILPESGTIMSYCHLISGVGIDFNNGFGPLPGDLIRDKYINASCNTGTCTPPLCTNLNDPVDGQTGVDVNQVLHWDSADGADGYKLTIGTTPTNGDILDNEDLGPVTSYDPVNPFPFATTIYVKIVPYNIAQGDAEGCVNESFMTEDNIAPSCTQLTNPVDGSTDVQADVVLTWSHSAGNQLGYKISIGTTPGGTDILNLEDVGNTPEYDHPSSYPLGTTLYVTIIPYWSGGDIEDCPSESFTTITPGSGDFCNTAIDLPCDAVLEGSTVDAMEDTGLPFCVADIEAPGIWYTFVGDGNNTVIETCMDDSYDTQLNAYEGVCGELQCITGNDDFCYRRSAITFPTEAGTTYYILVQGWGGEQGDYIIHRSCYDGPFYCLSSGRDAFSEWIGNVSFAGMENESGSSSYSDFMDVPIEVSRGDTYTIELTPEYAQSSRNEYFRVWIDFNHDGDFTDGGEQVFSAGPATSMVSGNIDIPITAAKGITRMRVSMRYNSNPSSSCSLFANGEVEDYVLNIKCNLVTSNQDDAGNGTLRNVSQCVDDGEDVLFDPSLNGQILKVMDGQIQVEGNWKWMAEAGSNITIQAEGVNRVLKIQAGNSIEIQNLNFIGGSALDGNAIDNLGDLILRDCNLYKPAGSQTSVLRNRGTVEIFGQCDIGD